MRINDQKNIPSELKSLHRVRFISIPLNFISLLLERKCLWEEETLKRTKNTKIKPLMRLDSTRENLTSTPVLPWIVSVSGAWNKLDGRFNSVNTSLPHLYLVGIDFIYWINELIFLQSNKCHVKNINKAYRTVCDKCADKEGVCSKCGQTKDIAPNPK